MAAAARTQLLLTCEHGGNVVPAAYRKLFRGHQRLLASHRGIDIGARDAARLLERGLGAPLVCARVSRLLVDLNRSIGHPQLYSELTRGLPAADREEILGRYYRPYRELVSAWIAARLRGPGRVVHVSVHSFTPVLHGERRRADVGLLYDPARRAEGEFCRAWAAALVGLDHGRTVRKNYPYRGTSDGFVRALRRHFPATRYLGLEIEINQALLLSRPRTAVLMRDVAATLAATLADSGR